MLLAPRKYKLLIATGIFPPQVGGPATYSKLLLDKLPEKGFDVKVESYGWTEGYPKLLRYIIFSLRVLKNSFWADIVYAQDPVFGLAVLCAAKLTGRRFYLKIVGDYAWEQVTQRFGVKDFLDEFSVNYGKYNWRVRFLKKVQKFVADRADRIVTPSQYLKNIVSNWGVKANKITVIYNSFNIPAINVSKTQKSHRTIISAGRLVPWKGFETLIELMPEIRKEFGEVKLTIAGDGPDKERLERRIKETASQDFVHLLGQLTQDKLFKHIQESDAFILNTAYEGFSHQLLEVMAIGTPIVTTKVGGNPELIDNEENGLLVSYNNKDELKKTISKVLNDREFASGLASSARNKVKQFSEEKMLNQLSVFLMA